MGFCLNPGITLFLEAATHARGFGAVRPQKNQPTHNPVVTFLITLGAWSIQPLAEKNSRQFDGLWNGEMAFGCF
ncbi:hypothetical protein [Pseudomonas sp. MHK4]